MLWAVRVSGNRTDRVMFPIGLPFSLFNHCLGIPAVPGQQASNPEQDL